MTTNTCPTCRNIVRDTVIEGMIEVIMDDNDVDYDTAETMLNDDAVEANITEYLATRPCNTQHGDWY